MSTFTYPIFYLLADIFEIFIIYRYMDLFFGWKQHTKVTYFAFVYYFLSTGILHLIIDAPIFNLIFSISAISFVTCTYRTRLWKKICVVLFLYCYMAVVELIVGNITGYAKTDMIGEGSYQNVAGLIIMKLLFFLGTLIFYNIKSMKLNSNLSIPIWSASCLIPIISVIIAFTLFFNEEIHTIQLIIALVLLVIANILIFYLYDLLAQFYMKRVDAEVLNKERQYYFHQCELMNQMQENTASYRHDLKNHMMVLAGLAEESKITEIQDYIEKNIASLPTTKVYSKTGNIYLDSIINFKLSEAEQLGTKLQYRVEAASDQVIDPRDLTIILGNLLDNAITAVASVSNKTIHFLYRETKGRIIISISNSYDGTVIMKNQKIISRKKDTRIHGYGLKNIEKTVDKYNGTVKILHDDNMFTVKLLLYV